MNQESEQNVFFGLDSSLKISPLEQVQVMDKIFVDNIQYSKKDTDLLKNILSHDKVNGYDIYGKTGSYPNKEGWFVGVSQKNEDILCFAVYVQSYIKNAYASGKYAREVVKKIFAFTKVVY